MTTSHHTYLGNLECADQLLETQRFNTHNTAQKLATRFSADKTYRFMQFCSNEHYPTITSSESELCPS